MTNFLLFLKDNAYVWAIIILISIALAFWGIVQNVRKKQLLFYVETNSIVEIKDRAVENISIYYADERIENLLVSKIAIFNRGNITINFSDIPVAAPILIKVIGEDKIISSTVLYQSNDSSQFGVSSLNQSYIEVNFDYLESKDGAVIQMMHTGPVQIVSFSGKLKGGRIITPPNYSDSKLTKFKKKLIYNGIDILKPFSVILGAVLFTTALYLLSPNRSSVTQVSEYTILSATVPVFTVLSFIFTVISYFSALVSRKSRLCLPKKLRKYFLKYW